MTDDSIISPGYGWHILSDHGQFDAANYPSGPACFSGDPAKMSLAWARCVHVRVRIGRKFSMRTMNHSPMSRIRDMKVCLSNFFENSATMSLSSAIRFFSYSTRSLITCFPPSRP